MKTAKSPASRIEQKQRMFVRLTFPSLAERKPLTLSSARRYLRAIFPESRS